MPANSQLTIFYDGACGICSREIRHYRSIADENLHFVDIAGNDFDAGKFGKSHADFEEKLHVCNEDGHFFTGVDAFRQLWDKLPSPLYPLLSSFIGLPGVHLAATAGYAIFARYRHLLPRRERTSCQIGSSHRRTSPPTRPKGSDDS